MPLVTILLQCGENGLPNIWRQIGIALAGVYWLLCDMLKHEHNGVRCGKRRLSGEEFVSDTGKRVLVAFAAHGALKLFGCHIARRTRSGRRFHAG